MSKSMQKQEQQTPLSIVSFLWTNNWRLAAGHRLCTEEDCRDMFILRRLVEKSRQCYSLYHLHVGAFVACW